MADKVKRGPRRESRTSPRRLLAMEKQRKAINLRLGGATFAQIADELGYATRWGAQYSVEAAIKKSFDKREIAIERELDIERLDKLLLSIWRAATAGDTKALDAAIKVLMHRARLLGLEAPVRQVLTGPEGGPIEVEVAFDDLKRKLDSIAARIRTPGLPEGSDA